MRNLIRLTVGGGNGEVCFSDGSALERTTSNEGFGSFPMFYADANKLVFGAARNPQKSRAADMFIADWDEK